MAELIYRCYIDGELMDESVVNDAKTARQTAAFQAALCAMAHAVGSLYMIEQYDPSMPEDQAYRRFGSDPRAMTKPNMIFMEDGDGPIH